MTTKRTWALSVLVSAVLLAGCSSDPSIQTLAPVPVHTFTPAPDAPDDAGYLANERRVYDFDGVPDSKLLDAGYAVCDALDAGVTVQTAHTTLTNTAGADPEMGNAVLAGAIVFLCPEYQPALNAYVSNP